MTPLPQPRPLLTRIAEVLLVALLSAILFCLFMGGVWQDYVPHALFLIWTVGCAACLIHGLLSPTWGQRALRVLAGGTGLVIAAGMYYIPIMVHERSSRFRCLATLTVLAERVLEDEKAKGTLALPYVADTRGQAMHSWRVAMLPYLDQGFFYRLYRQDEPWDGPNNTRWHSMPLSVFQCPLDGSDGRSPQTSYLAITGPGTVWDAPRPLPLAKIGDGASNTVLLTEVHRSGILWVEPRDLHTTQMNPHLNGAQGQGPSGHDPRGVNVAFADGSVRFIRNDALTGEQFRALLTANGGEGPVPLENVGLPPSDD